MPAITYWVEKVEMAKNEIHGYTRVRDVTLGRKAVLHMKHTYDNDVSWVFCRARMEPLLFVHQRINEKQTYSKSCR